MADPEPLPEPLVLDRLTLDSIVGGEQPHSTWFFYSTAAQTAALPLQAREIMVTGIATNGQVYLSWVNQTAAQIQGSSGLKNDVMLMCYTFNFNQVNVIVAPNRQLYLVTSGIAAVTVVWRFT